MLNVDHNIVSLKDYMAEQASEQPYRVLNLIHDTPDDPNKTGDAMEIQAKKMGILKEGDLVVETAGTLTDVSGSTDLIKVGYV